MLGCGQVWNLWYGLIFEGSIHQRTYIYTLAFDLNFNGQTGSCACKWDFAISKVTMRGMKGTGWCRWMAMNDDRDGERSRGKGRSERGFLGREVERRGSLHTPQSLLFNHVWWTHQRQPPNHLFRLGQERKHSIGLECKPAARLNSFSAFCRCCSMQLLLLQ